MLEHVFYRGAPTRITFKPKFCVRKRGIPATAAHDGSCPSNRERAVTPRLNRKLSPSDLKQLRALYEAGESMQSLAKKFECHRHTVMRHLQGSGVEIRPQRKMTPELVAQAEALYTGGQTLEEVARFLGLEASTIGKALKRSGATLRPPVADRWHESLPD